MEIKLTHDQILDYGTRYIDEADVGLGKRMKAAAKRGHMTGEDLIAVAKWKWSGGRTRQLCAINLEEEVVEISSVSFAAKTERLRVGVLLALSGVGWPMASVILHFAFPKRYPILDIRVMKSVGGSGSYTFEMWSEYSNICREAATKHAVSMRTLDRALWAYDKDAAS